MKEKILVSACLLGKACRYDGKSKKHPDIEKVSEKFEIIPICPEVLGGLDTPRLPCELRNGKAIRSDGEDMTDFYSRGAEITLEKAKEDGCKIALLKEKSPSCGSGFIYDGSFLGKLIQGQGITATLLAENNIRVVSEDEIEKII